jgi:hypothetical protein
MPDARKLKKIKEEIAKEAARRGQRAGGLWFSGNKAAQIAKKVGGTQPQTVGGECETVCKPCHETKAHSKLRLTPQTRFDARAAERYSAVPSDDAPRPWDRRAHHESGMGNARGDGAAS